MISFLISPFHFFIFSPFSNFLHIGPSLFIPLDGGEEERSAAGATAALDVAMVEDVFLSVLSLEDFSAVARSVEAVALVALEHGGGEAILHGSAFTVEEGVGEALGPAHLKLVGVVAKEA